MKTAVGIANEYLASNAMEAVDLAQIERLKKDQQKAWEAETGESIGIVQWIAQKLNADVYLEIDGAIAVRKVKDHYRQRGDRAQDLRGFHRAPARLGAVEQPGQRRSSRPRSRRSPTRCSRPWTRPCRSRSARPRPRSPRSSRTASSTSWCCRRRRTQVVSAFRNRLRDAREGRAIGQPVATRRRPSRCGSSGSVDDLVDLVVDVAGKVPGLEGLRQVLLRGKSVTFTTGM